VPTPKLIPKRDLMQRYSCHCLGDGDPAPMAFDRVHYRLSCSAMDCLRPVRRTSYFLAGNELSAAAVRHTTRRNQGSDHQVAIRGRAPVAAPADTTTFATGAGAVRSCGPDGGSDGDQEPGRARYLRHVRHHGSS
jgi:hypothetical protein